ncbi:prepilin-type N-terminal cleavage/methylation domain-containing protein [Sedimentisphaera salicampi]|uniref:Type II secretion system protein G n=1 Tax=Sedimentisphaera salicampi TaxID=1941349 RepID=A0A1W6LPF2_9BACT|nr:type II secretion system protein [Sedimentisphaera salicampi]ARN57631.1 type II secretion system protein G [Sedimentisphaera salicampi]OXU14199.1 type II secretion system protein G [Sedimentisphaera salicampi]
MKAPEKNKGFTIIELLVVISIIAMLMSVIGVAAGRVRIVSKNMQQAANIHSMGVGLELFEKEFGFFPDSTRMPLGGSYVYGAQQLAEGLVGRDLAGVDEDSGFYVASREQKRIDNEPTYYDVEEEKSRNNRVGPYLNIDRESINVVEPSQLYDDYADGGIYCQYNADSHSISNGYLRAPVISDNYNMKRVELESGSVVQAGTPVLYFRSNPSAKYFRPGENTSWTSMDEEACSYSVYNYYDNIGFFEMENLKNPEEPHRFAEGDADGNGKDGKQEFYEFITSRKVGSYDMPVRKDTYIIISAGYDGAFGTDDDITNFDN